MSESTMGVSALGRVILILGLCALAATGLPYAFGRYDAATGERIAEETKAERERAFEERGHPLYQQELWFPILQKRADNPAWVSLRDGIAAYEHEAAAFTARQDEAEQRARKGRLRANRYQTAALLTMAVTVAGLLIVVLGRAKRATPQSGEAR